MAPRSGTLAVVAVVAIAFAALAVAVIRSGRSVPVAPPANPSASTSSAASASPTVASDLAQTLAQLRRALPPPARLDDLAALWPDLIRRARAEPLGFELERRTIRFRSEPGHGWICAASAVSRNGDLLELLESCDFNSSALDASAPGTLEQAFQPEFEWVKGPFTKGHDPWARAVALRRNTQAYEAAVARSALDLGSVAPGPLPEDLRVAYSVLSSPSYELALGKACSFGLKEGYWEMIQLEESNRVDLLRSALRGLNPEGRYLAAYALYQLGANNADDDRAIARLPQVSPESVTVCAGDATWPEPPKRDAKAWLRERLSP
jgi:hypothetical protein